MNKPVILIVDTNRSNLETLAQELGQEGYEILKATGLDEIDQAIQGKAKFALAVIDLSGFKEGIWERCDCLREAKIPCIVVAPQRSPTIQRDAMKHGASGLLVKPVATRELIEHIHTALGD
jgi:CheY-like chemotaxis protein